MMTRTNDGVVETLVMKTAAAREKATVAREKAMTIMRTANERVTTTTIGKRR